jgi:hypothetical protein
LVHNFDAIDIMILIFMAVLAGFFLGCALGYVAGVARR